jgi:hypothetical protein
MKRKDISLKTYLGEESKFNINFDYNRFIINKEAKPFRKNGILEVHSIVKVSPIDNDKSKFEYSIRYSDLSIFLIVVLNLSLIIISLFTSNFNLFGESIQITGIFEKSFMIVIGLVLANFLIWISFNVKKVTFQKVIDLIINSIKNDTPNTK